MNNNKNNEQNQICISSFKTSSFCKSTIVVHQIELYYKVIRVTHELNVKPGGGMSSILVGGGGVWTRCTLRTGVIDNMGGVPFAVCLQLIENILRVRIN